MENVPEEKTDVKPFLPAGMFLTDAELDVYLTSDQVIEGLMVDLKKKVER